MMKQRSSNEKQTNMWNQIASSASNQRTKFVGCTLKTCDFTRWRRLLQDGVANSEKCIAKDIKLIGGAKDFSF